MKKTKVMVFGTFDYLHPGHLHFFLQAKKHGDYLIVVIARDENVKRFKGALPRYNETDRLTIVQNSDVADEVILGDPDSPYRVIEENKPEVICLGYDQHSYTEGLQERFPDIKIVRLEPYHPELYKSSILKKI